MEKVSKDTTPINPIFGDILVSTVSNAHGVGTKNTKISVLLDSIKNGKWRDEIEIIRDKYQCAEAAGIDPKKSVAQEKKLLPAILWSGTFSRRVASELLAHSGILCADIDDIKCGLDQVRAKLMSSPHVWAIFCSPSGTGLKVLFRVKADTSTHLASFQAVAAHVNEITGLEIDQACKDVSRLCFISHDPCLWVRPNEPEMIVQAGTLRLYPESCITACCLPTHCVSTSLHNKAHPTADMVLANIIARKNAMQALTTHNRHLPGLYEQHVEKRHAAEPHARNAFIVKAVPFLFRAVATKFVLPLVVCFYDCNRALFNDSLDEHIAEARAMLEGVERRYIESLPKNEREIYHQLEMRERNAFRICRDLAALDRPDKPIGVYFMSFEQLGQRLGILPMQAQRLMRRLERDGMIKQTKKGTLRKLGVRGEAGTYQWCLSLEPMPPATGAADVTK